MNHADLPEHGCCRIAEGPDGEPCYCGQYCGHVGDCTWWTPGGYLSPRLITPLDWFDAGWPGEGPLWRIRRCPMCGAGVSFCSGDFSHVIYCDAEDAERDGVRWAFEPCGCEGRELL